MCIRDRVTAEQLAANGAVQVLSFGPALIENGRLSVSEDTEVGRSKASNPRTAIGIVDNLHYVFVVSDGRTEESEGLSLLQLAEFMQKLGVQTAYNLDGGGSSTMVFNGTVINNPTTSGRTISERSVSDIVYICLLYTSSLQYNTVQRDFFTGLDDNGVSNSHLVRIHLHKCAVPLDIGIVRADIHQGGNGFTRASH